ncbi:MAG: rhodanese-like domain-containing protein [Methyloprofundus sp.]|nr:rhodanese-like domain-containing protein [Methyloprofundus sp.]
MRITQVLLFLSIFISPLLSAENLKNLSTADMQEKINAGALVIDIRTKQEWQQTGIIPGSHPLNFFDKNGNSDPEKWVNTLQSLKSSPDQEVILVCHSGNRSGRVGTYLSSQLNMSHIAHLSTGISSWLREKRPTQTTCTTTQPC